MADITQNPTFLAGLSMMRGVDPGTALMQAQKSQAYTQHLNIANEQQQYQLEQQRKLQQILPQIMAQMGDKSGTQILQELVAQGVPAEAAISLADSISKAKQREQLGQFLTGQGGGIAGAGGGEVDKLAAAAAMNPQFKPLLDVALSRQAQQDKLELKDRELKNTTLKEASEKAEAAFGLLRSLDRLQESSDGLGDKGGTFEGNEWLQDPLRLLDPEGQAYRDDYSQAFEDAKSLYLKARYGTAQLSNADLQSAGKLLPSMKYERKVRDRLIKRQRKEAEDIIKRYQEMGGNTSFNAEQTEDDDLDALMQEMKRRGLK